MISHEAEAARRLLLLSHVHLAKLWLSHLLLAHWLTHIHLLLLLLLLHLKLRLLVHLHLLRHLLLLHKVHSRLRLLLLLHVLLLEHLRLGLLRSEVSHLRLESIHCITLALP